VADAGNGSRVVVGTGAGGRRPWAGRRVLLGVTGGIAAYKAIQLARDLAELGAQVDTVLTRRARAFVGAVSFEALTGRPCHTDMWEPGRPLAHIALARSAEVVCVAPATADFLARAAAGRANDLLTAILLATRAPVLLCPAMNDRMWAHPQTQANARQLRAELGYRLVGPAIGPLAWDEGEGPGRMEEPAAIVEHIGRALGTHPALSGRAVVVTAGPTREPVDAVRVLSNRSSGRMGFALAAAAWRRGADVVLIAGPAAVPPPAGPLLVSVETAEQMATAVARHLPSASALIMTAAVADFRPAAAHAGKLKKSAMPAAIELEPVPDILLATRAVRPPGCYTIGFALEAERALEHARTKLQQKELDLIVLNSPGPGSGFEVETNQVTLLDRDGGSEELPLLGKDEVAERILDRVVAALEHHD
jgi:phosphopantothenoylcysteine decarboxylase/phosphopantothenate--cysteine ligase